MRKTTWICDRCGKEFIWNKKDVQNRLLILGENDFDGDSSPLDLCPICYGDLEKWMKCRQIGIAG